MLFLGSGTDLDDTSYVKNVTLLKYWCDLQLVFYYPKISNFLWRKNEAHYTPIGVLYPDRGIYPDRYLSPAWLPMQILKGSLSVMKELLKMTDVS